MSLSKLIMRLRAKLSDEVRQEPRRAFKPSFKHRDFFTSSAQFSRRLVGNLALLSLTCIGAVPFAVGATAVIIAILTGSLTLSWPPVVLTAGIILGVIAIFGVLAAEDIEEEVKLLPLPTALEPQVRNMNQSMDQIVELACWGILAEDADARLLSVEASNFYDDSLMRLHQLFAADTKQFFKALPGMTGQITRKDERDPLVKEVNEILSSVSTLKAVEKKLKEMKDSRAKVMAEEAALTKKLHEEERLAALSPTPPSLKLESSRRNLEDSLFDVTLKEKSREKAKVEIKEHLKNLGKPWSAR